MGNEWELEKEVSGKGMLLQYPSWSETVIGNKQATEMKSKVTKFGDYHPTDGWYLSFQERGRVPH